MSGVEVVICASSGTSASTVNNNVYDIWTAGTYGALISQGITFTAPTTPVNYGVAPITLVATGGASGNPVTFSVLSGPGTVSGNILTVTGVGTITVAADQAGNSSYSAAAEVTQSIVVNQASQTIDFIAPASPEAYGASPIGLSATASSGLTPTFSIISGPGSVSGNTLTMTGQGTIVIAANQAGNANYAAAPQVTQSVVVTLPSQTISFTAPLTEPYGTAPITLTATATSGLAVSFSVLSGPGTLSGSTLTFTGSGTVVVAANQAGSSSYAAAPQVTQSITVAAATGAQPQTQLAPISAVNAKYVQGVGPGFWPTAGSGLSVTLTAGTANCAGTIENYSATALALIASTTNYIYLNTAAACAPAVKTTAFTSSDIPIATIVTGASSITSIQDDRTMFGNGGIGLTGPAGTNGNTIWSGISAPSSGTGVNGDFYLNMANSCLYGPKASGTWPGTCISLIGPSGSSGAAGTNGNTIWNGTSAPSSGTGVNGDFYLNTANSCLYGPKGSGAWPGTCTSLIGATGASGTGSGTVNTCGTANYIAYYAATGTTVSCEATIPNSMVSGLGSAALEPISYFDLAGAAAAAITTAEAAIPAASSMTPAMNGTGAAGTSSAYARTDHVHPTDSSRVSTGTTVNGHALSANVTISASDLTTGTLPHAQLPALVSGDIPANAANTTGTAANITAAATLPSGTTISGATLNVAVLSFGYAGTPPASQYLGSMLPTSLTYSVASGCTNSKGFGSAASTTTDVFQINKCTAGETTCASVGTVTFTSSATGVFACSSAFTITSGQSLNITAPSTAATIVNPTFSIEATHN
jgi:hypothetical protein